MVAWKSLSGRLESERRVGFAGGEQSQAQAIQNLYERRATRAVCGRFLRMFPR